jgi:hypothetical protein
MNMKALLKGLLLSCVLLALTGCNGVTGRWTIDTVEPPAAKVHVPITAFCLMSDGTYCACKMEGDKCTPTKGTYKFDQPGKQLTFTPSEGKERVYKAELVDAKLKVWSEEKGKEWTAMLVHGKCCGKPGQCGKDGCCMAGKGDCCKADAGKGCGGCKADAGKPCDPAKCPAAKADAKPAEKKPDAKKADPKK